MGTTTEPQRSLPPYGEATVHLKTKEQRVIEKDVTADDSWKSGFWPWSEPRILFVPMELKGSPDERWVASYRDWQLARYLEKFYGVKVQEVQEGDLGNTHSFGASNTAIILCIHGHGGEGGTISSKRGDDWFKLLQPLIDHHKVTLRLLYVFGCHGAALATGWHRLEQKETAKPGLQKLLSNAGYRISVRGMWQNMTVTASGEPVGKSDRDKDLMNQYVTKQTTYNGWCTLGPLKLNKLGSYGQDPQMDKVLIKDYEKQQQLRATHFLYKYPLVSREALSPLVRLAPKPFQSLSDLEFVFS